MQPETTFDCVIVGGGLVGATLAVALRDQPLNIGLIEAVPFQSSQQPAYDDRGLGVAPSSQRIFAQLGLWSQIAPDATPIKHIHISDKGHPGITHLNAAKMGVDQLGHVVIGRTLGQVLHDAMRGSNNLSLFNPASVKSIEKLDESVNLTIQQADQVHAITTKLLIVADGGQSWCRDQLGIEVEEKDYGQTAIVTIVSPEKPHNNTAYERFTKTGPLAILPSTEGRCVSVWTCATEEADSLLAMDDAQFKTALAQRLGYRLGRFTRLGQRRAYPMKLIKAKEMIGHRFVILGNAAHTIHPNAAQGMNLGLRDVAHLAECLADAARHEQDPGDMALLHRYEQARISDHNNVIRFSDGLTRLFYNDNPLLIGLRTSAMIGLEMMPFAKRALIQRAMGLTGATPRLVRGLPL